jgi:hypothetical protein
MDYAVLENGQIVFYYHGNMMTATLRRDDYEQFEALYPDGPKMDERFFEVYDVDVTETLSDTSSEFISNPDDHHEHSYQAGSPFKRPSNPEPPSPTKAVVVDRPIVVQSHYPPQQREEKEDNHHATTPSRHAEDDGYFSEDEIPRAPFSPYKKRESFDFWTGLDLCEWGTHSYVTHSGHMAVLKERQIQSGVCHGMLQQCRFGLWESPDQVLPAPAAGVPELKLTTPEGLEYYPDDCFERVLYTYEFEYSPEDDWKYGHRCNERCYEFYSEFGWDGYEELAEEGTMDRLLIDLERSGADERTQDEALIEFCMDDSDDEEMIDEVIEPEAATPKVKLPVMNPPKKSSSSKKGKRVEFVPRALSIIFEDDDEDNVTDNKSTPIDDDENSDVESVKEDAINLDFVDALETAVNEECERRQKENATTTAVHESTEEKKSDDGKKKLPLWVRDPTYISNKKWEDLDDEDSDEEVASTESDNTEKSDNTEETDNTEESDNTEPSTVVDEKKEELPLWVRDPFYISGKKWEDLMDEEDDEADTPSAAVVAVEKKKEEVPLWVRDPFYISGKSWEELMEEDE